MKVEFTPQALADLRHILEYISRDKPLAAHRFVDLLEQECHRLASMPYSGTIRDDLLESLRVLAFRRYSIFFRTADEIVLIVRVLGPGQDPTPAHFR